MGNKLINGVTIIGQGKLGSLFIRSFKDVGVENVDIITKNQRIDHLQPFVFLCVPDDKIEQVANHISKVQPDLKNKTIMHCSGTVGLSVLHQLEESGAVVGCMHPMMAVNESSTSFYKITFDICGPEEFLKKAKSIARLLGAKTVVVDEAQKKKIHIASVVASNYLVTLMHTAQEISGANDSDTGTLSKALLSLMQSSIKNLRTFPPPDALTGPIARGDISTITDHLEMLKKEHPGEYELYRTLGVSTLEMIGHRLPKETRDHISRLFHES